MPRTTPPTTASAAISPGESTAARERFEVLFEHYLRLTALTKQAIVHGLDAWEAIDDRRQALEGTLRRRDPDAWRAHVHLAEAAGRDAEHTVGPAAADRCDLCASGLYLTAPGAAGGRPGQL